MQRRHRKRRSNIKTRRREISPARIALSLNPLPPARRSTEQYRRTAGAWSTRKRRARNILFAVTLLRTSTQSSLKGASLELIVARPRPLAPIAKCSDRCSFGGRHRPALRASQLWAQQQKSCLYSITSSASNCREFGTSIPSDFAAFKLMTSSNLVGCSTGRSAGFLPMRIWPIRAPPCRYISSGLAP